jgi:hypothetical protein
MPDAASTTETHWYLRFANGMFQTCGTGAAGLREAEREAQRIARNAARDSIARATGPGSEWSRSCFPIEVVSVEVTTYEPVRGPDKVAATLELAPVVEEMRREARRAPGRGQRGSEAGCYA